MYPNKQLTEADDRGYLSGGVLLLAVLSVLALNPARLAATETDVVLQLYREHCAECHGENRLGGMGPALLPENLKRLKRQTALEVIRHGHVATQMPAFAEKLSPQDTNSLAAYIYTPLPQTPVWDLAEIGASHIVHNQPGELPHKAVFEVDTRVRAFQLTGDPWCEDPACYLDDQELGISEADYAGDEPESMGVDIRSIRHAG
jgi:mono/diheme cytochrome c family protein